MLSLIAAVARNRVIGKDNQLLWHLPEDMKYFREVTRGHPVIMGRKTWESLPEKFRPLPGRHNIVVSRNNEYEATGATLVTSLEDAVTLTQDNGEAFVIGGEAIYRLAIPIAQRIYLTEIDCEFDGDAFFPELPTHQWKNISKSRAFCSSNFNYFFSIYERQSPSVAI